MTSLGKRGYQRKDARAPNEHGPSGGIIRDFVWSVAVCLGATLVVRVTFAIMNHISSAGGKPLGWFGPLFIAGALFLAVVFFVSLNVFRLYWERRHPFELDPGRKTLWYRGRRNVAFGCETINCIFAASVAQAKTREEGERLLREVGRKAGEAFARELNRIITRFKERKGRVPKVDQVFSMWEEYDENVGFGDIDRGRSCLKPTEHGVEGEVHIGNLFTATPGYSEWRCPWMCGYLEGLLNKTEVLMGDGSNAIAVSHDKCVRRTGSDGIHCVFDVRIQQSA